MSLLTLPDPSTELGAAVEVALAACDVADAISLASFRRNIAIEAKPYDKKYRGASGKFDWTADD